MVQEKKLEQIESQPQGLEPKVEVRPSNLRVRALVARELQRALSEVHYLEVKKPKLEAQIRSMIRLQCTLLGRHLNLDLVRVDLLHLLQSIQGGSIRIGDVDRNTGEGLSLAFVISYEDGSFLTGTVEVALSAIEPQRVFKRDR